MSLKYELSSEPLHISAKWLFLHPEPHTRTQAWPEREAVASQTVAHMQRKPGSAGCLRRDGGRPLRCGSSRGKATEKRSWKCDFHWATTLDCVVKPQTRTQAWPEREAVASQTKAHMQRLGISRVFLATDTTTDEKQWLKAAIPGLLTFEELTLGEGKGEPLHEAEIAIVDQVSSHFRGFSKSQLASCNQL